MRANISDSIHIKQLTLLRLMEFISCLMQLSKDGSLYILRGYRFKFQKNIMFLSLKIYFVLVNSADHNEIQHFP